MAEGIFYLRPSADISVNHTMKPADSTAAYLLINETEHDGFLTTIKVETGTHDTKTSTFKLSLDEGVSLPKVISAQIIIHIGVTMSGSHRFTVFDGSGAVIYELYALYEDTVSSGSTFHITDTEGIDEVRSGGAQTFAFNTSALVDYVNRHDDSDLILTITTSADVNSEKSTASAFVSQAIFKLVCETSIGIHRKVGGVVKAATAAYKKVGGSWVEVPEEEAKDILNNNIITQGGS